MLRSLPVINLQGKKVTVLGTRPSPAEVLTFLIKEGARVRLAGLPEEKKEWNSLEGIFSKKSIEASFLENLPENLLETSLVVCNHKERYEKYLRKFQITGVPILNNLELVCEKFNGKLLAITGSNGKSTTAKMVELMLQESKISVALAGGDFLPYFEAVAKRTKVLIAEINSYNLSQTHSFHPPMVIMTNLSPIHRERHGGRSTKYIQAKAKIFANQNSNDLLIYNADNEPLVKLIQGAKAGKVPVFIPAVPNPFKEKMPEGPKIYFKDTKIWLQKVDGEVEEYETTRIKLRAQHDLENALAAVAAARLLGAEPKAIQKVLDGFSGLPHCMQKVISKKGIDWYDDSRSTNPTATAWGVWRFQKLIILIIGGKEVHADYSFLAPSFKGRVKLLILVGQSRRMMHGALEGVAETYLVKTLAEAVKLAYFKGQKGDQVVYSPACPPEHGLYENRTERGDQFVELIETEIRSDLRDKVKRITRI